jgi:hypothetical protein
VSIADLAGTDVRALLSSAGATSGVGGGGWEVGCVCQAEGHQKTVNRAHCRACREGLKPTLASCPAVPHGAVAECLRSHVGLVAVQRARQKQKKKLTGSLPAGLTAGAVSALTSIPAHRPN